MIDVESISKSFGGAQVLREMSCHFSEGERIAIIGPSGAGKSVFLRCLNGLEHPDSGDIRVEGVSLMTGSAQARARARLRTGMVFQQFNLFSHLNVIDNIAMAPMRVKKLPAKQAFEQAEALLEMVGLPDKRTAYPRELSGGQMQRVGIARALAMTPDILLFDEPTSALDPSMTGEVLAVIEKVAGQAKLLIIVTHELPFVRDIASRVLLLDEGGVYEEGTPEQLLAQPKKPKTRQFLERLHAQALTEIPVESPPDTRSHADRPARDSSIPSTHSSC